MGDQPALSRLYKYVTIDTLKRILTSGIRFTQPGAFNDPFELLPELGVPEAEGEKQLNISFDIHAQRRSPPIGELGPDAPGFNCSDINSRNILAELNKQIGILCLSKNRDSLLMWAHYGDQYSGAVLEFDGAHDFLKGQIEVEYRSSRAKKDISSYVVEGHPVPIAELCSKSDQWAYEGEVRIIRTLAECQNPAPDGGRGFPIYVQPVPKECIREITLGERTTVAHQREIWDLVKETEISLSLAAVANWGYDFRREQIKFNRPLSTMGPMVTPRTAHIFSDHPGHLGEVARYLIENHHLSDFVNKKA